jgi:hypothetical protein
MSGFVYKWYNTENDMYYIGSHGGSVDDKYIGSGIYFKRAYKKNPDCFFREIMYEGEHYIIYEHTILQYLDAKNDPNCYNLTNSAIYRPLGRKSAEDTRIKISKGNKGKNVSKESREKMSKARKGIKLSEETKKKISESKKGKKLSKEHRRKISEIQKGKPKPKGTGEKISKSKSQKVYCGYLGKEFKSMKSCAKYLGISASKLTLQVQGKIPNIYKVKKII